MTYEELVSPLMEFFNQGADKQLGARRRDKDGNIEMTKWDHVTGRTQEELNKAAQKRLNNTDQAEEYRRLTGTTDDLPTSMRRTKLNSEVSRLQGGVEIGSFAGGERSQIRRRQTGEGGEGLG